MYGSYESMSGKDAVKGAVKPAGPLVEDTQTVGGTDKKTGADVIRPKMADGKADKVTEATDPSERS